MTELWSEDRHYGRIAELFPVSLLDKLKEYDRSREAEEDPEVRARIDDIKQSIQEEGFREPLMLLYNPYNGVAILGEGNHRLAAAKELGLECVPLRIYRSRGMTKNRELWKSANKPVEVQGALLRAEEGEYTPQEMSPSQVFPPGTLERCRVTIKGG